MNDFIRLCKCGFVLDVDPHLIERLSAQAWLLKTLTENEAKDIDMAVMKDMIERDIVVRLDFFPNTPSGGFVVYGSDLDIVLKSAMQLIELDKDES